MSAKKHTIKNTVHVNGTGIHTGERIRLRIAPSQSGQIIFHRTDIPGFSLPAQAGSAEARRNTALVWENKSIQTIEHLMAAFFLAGIDSADVYVSGPEIPSVDGSAGPYLKLLQEAGAEELKQNRILYEILQPFSLKDSQGTVSGFPSAGFRLSYEIEFDHPLIGRQEMMVEGNPWKWRDEIAPARTFGFLKDVPALRKKKLARGGSLDNALVLDDKSVINGPLRFEDEFVRHKLLDLMGDLFLLGGYFSGHIQAKKAGHNLHLQAVRYLRDNPEIMKQRNI